MPSSSRSSFPMHGLLVVVIGGHGDYLGEAVVTQRATRAPELTAGFVEEFLDAP